MDETMQRTLILVGLACVMAAMCLMLFNMFLIRNMSPGMRKLVIGVLVFAVFGMMGAIFLLG